jgi:hypothetical protein
MWWELDIPRLDPTEDDKSSQIISEDREGRVDLIADILFVS